MEFLAAWRGCNPVIWLARHFGLTVAMENDADAAALGEMQWGAGRGKRHLICVTVGTGIGGGIVLNGVALPRRGRSASGDRPPCHRGVRAAVLLRRPRLLGSARARAGDRRTLCRGRTARISRTANG